MMRSVLELQRGGAADGAVCGPALVRGRARPRRRAARAFARLWARPGADDA